MKPDNKKTGSEAKNIMRQVMTDMQKEIDPRRVERDSR